MHVLPACMFCLRSEIGFFAQHPAPFYRLCKELWPGAKYRPTATHHFITLLHRKELLCRCYTQNIDSLESAAGLPKEAVVAAHGNFDSASCILPGSMERKSVPIEEVRAAASTDGMAAWDALNAKHGGLCKPDIVFFGENLPPRFFSLLQSDFPECDLLIVMCVRAGG